MSANRSDFVPLQEVADAWGVTRRYVNMCIADGRILGAMKVGNMWLLPKDAQKPTGKHEKKPPEKSFSSDLAHVITATYIPAPRDNPDAILDIINEERVRVVPEIALAYARGDFEQARRRFRTIANDDAVKLCACSATIAAAINMGDYPFYMEVEGYLKSMVQANSGSDVSAFAELALASSYLGAMAPNMVPDWLKDGDFSSLIAPVKPDALYKRAKYFQCIGQYESMLTVAQTALAFCDSKQEVSLTCIYLRLMCAAALYALERIDEAKRWLLDAMRIYLPIGIITPFVELILPFGGLVEQCLEKEFPAHYDAVIEQWKRTVPNWLTFHNHFTADNITLILSRRDYEMALMAAQGVPYAKIAKQFHVSVGRLTNIMRAIYEKLFISGKKELVKFLLLPPKKT